jgi:hypothetical protein
MAKRNIRKTDPEITSTPERRHETTTDSNGRAAAPKTTRSRRKSDTTAVAPAALSASAEVAPITAEGALETPATTPNSPADSQAQVAAPAFTTVAEVATIELSHDKIAERAYHLYLERGRQPGDPFADWLTAERELRERFLGA